jgi:hypothetical protein
MSDEYKAFLWDGLAVAACCYAVAVAVTALLTFI